MKSPLTAWRSTPAAVRAAAAFTVSSIILKGIGFLTTPLFTRLMDATQYGILATYTSWSAILEVFAVLGLTSAGVIHVGLREHPTSRDRYLSVTLTLCNVVTVVVFGILFAIRNVWAPLPVNLMWLLCLHFLLSPAQVFWLMRHKYEHTYKAAVSVTVASAVLSQIVSVVAVLTIRRIPSAYVKLWSGHLATLLFVIPLNVLMRKRGGAFIDRNEWKSTARLSLPLLPHYLAEHVTAGADRILLAALSTSAAAGVYTVVANINTITGIVWNAVNASFVPFVFERLTDKGYMRLDRITGAILMEFGGLCTAVCLAAPEVIRILAPPTYVAGMYAVPPLAAASVLSAAHTVFSNVEFYHKRAGYITLSSVTAAGVNVLLNVVLVPRFHLLGAAYATLCSYAVLTTMHYLGYRHCSPPVYRIRRLLLILSGGVGACLISGLLYPYPVIRYGVLAVLLVVGIKKSRRLLDGKNS